MGFFSSKPIDHHRHCSLYLSVVIACLLLGLTNATNDTTDTKTGLLGKAGALVNQAWESFIGKSDDNSTAASANDSSSENVTSLFHKPKNMSDVRTILLAILQLLAQVFIIFGGVIPYIPQYLIIKRKQNSEGFSNYVCLTLLLANIIRIEFWFGKRFETPLLLQSIVMIICMLIMLELWTRVHSQTMRGHIALEQQSVAGSKEQLTDDISPEKKFTDFEVSYFWRWTTFISYIQCLLIFTAIMSLMTWLLLKNVVYIETIGFLAVFVEALLGVPQFVRNFRFRSTEGMSVKMVLLWAAGDIFKTVYFIFRKAPIQFWLCGALQITIDFAILCQVLVYSSKFSFRKT